MTDDEKWARLAAAALQRAKNGEHGVMIEYIRRINDECGPAGMAQAVLAWCDAFVAYAWGGEHVPTISTVNMIMVDGDTGRLSSDDDPAVPTPARWAARLLAARAKMDKAEFDAILEDVPDDGDTRGKHIIALVTCVGDTIRKLPPGYGRQPKPEWPSLN